MRNNCIASPSCTFHSHCVYEHVSSTDTDEGEFEVMLVLVIKY